MKTSIVTISSELIRKHAKNLILFFISIYLSTIVEFKRCFDQQRKKSIKKITYNTNGRST